MSGRGRAGDADSDLDGVGAGMTGGVGIYSFANPNIPK